MAFPDYALAMSEPPTIDAIASSAGANEASDACYERWRSLTTDGPLKPIRDAMDAMRDMPDFHAACGVFAAVSTTPEMWAPSRWLALIQGKHVFESKADLERFIGSTMELHSAVVDSISSYQADCVPPPQDEKAIQLFCMGYLQVAANDRIWEADEPAFVELLPMLALGGFTPMDKVGELLPAAKEDPEAWLQEARKELPITVATLYRYWASARQETASEMAARAPRTPREGSKVGRNDPCPCGSGKKFKRCCAH